MALFWCFSLLTVLAIQAEEVVSPTTTALRCLHEQSKKCTISKVQYDQNERLMLPNLHGKTTLQIKGGTLPAFDEQFCEKLGTVKRLQMGPLQLKQLCLTPGLQEVSAASNKIDTLKILFSGPQFKLEHLDLRNNAMKSLDGFKELVNLVEVHLEHNELESFDWAVFGSMTKLEKLYLNGNKISNVVADLVIELPVLEYLSLASNQLTNLNVLNWKFESLVEYDISSNKLSQVNNLKDRFPSSQAVSLANNQWFCGWLQETWEDFNRTLVVIKDRDEHCEGITSANICCTPERDIIPDDTELQVKLTKLEEDQKALQSSLELKFHELRNENDRELTGLESMLANLASSLSSTNTVTSDSSTQFELYSKKLQELNSIVDKELKQVSAQLDENQKAQLRLTYTVLELRRSIERSRKSVAGLQGQLDNLRTDIYRKAKQVH